MSKHSSDSNSDEYLTLLGHKIPASQLKSLLNFFNADHQLNQKERKILADDLSAARSSLLVTGMISSTMALFVPSMNKHFREQAKVKLAGTSQPSKNLVFHKPMLSAMLATGVYFGTMYYVSKGIRDRKILDLERELRDYLLDEEQRASKARLLDVWRALNAARVPLFVRYYQDTAVNPSYIMKDPRSLVITKTNEVNYLPLTRRSQELENQPTTAWSHIRQENGFDESKLDNQDQDINTDILDLNDKKDYTSFSLSDSSYEVPSFEEGATEESQQFSAWEKIRKRK